MYDERCEDLRTKYEQFLFVVSGIHRYIQKIERDEMEKYGYKGAFAQYLAAMSRYPMGVTSAQLCEICDKDKAAVSRIVAEMEGKGLVIRETENDTMYRAKLRLTDEGKHAAEFVCKRAQAAVSAGGTGLNDEERQIFYRVLDQISGNLEKISREGITQDTAKISDI